MRFWLVLLSSAIFVGCDPGWRYHLAPPLAAVPLTKSEPIRVELVRADVFSPGFDVTVRVVNATASDIVIDSVELIVRDARDTSLAQRSLAGVLVLPRGLKIYPAFGRSSRDGHNFLYRSVPTWEHDVLAFLRTHLQR